MDGREARAVVERGPVTARSRAVAELSTRELVSLLGNRTAELARKEVELAKSELRADLRAEVKMASGLGVAGVCALCTLNLLLVAVVLGLQEADVLSGWLAAIVVAAVVLLVGTVAGLLGWRKRVRTPLAATRRSVEEGARWVKRHFA